MFRTEIYPDQPAFNIDIKSSLLSLGSCFANDIGNRLSSYKFNILTNPGGILFNPLSIFELIEMAIEERIPEESTFLEHETVHLNHKLHSDIHAISKPALIERIEQINKELKSRLSEAEVIILTFGTAWVYRIKDEDTLVANCHKVPQNQFTKKLLSKEEIVDHFNSLRTQILKLNPNVKFLLTVSPVRHIKDTLPLNGASKATLRLACHELAQANTETSYFPSYELMMDDLRDYRFYKSDMLHPTEQAVDYIWQKFTESYLNHDTRSFVAKWEKIRTAMKHRPFHPSSVAHQNFLKDLIQKIENLSTTVEVSQELATLKSQLV